MFDKLRRAPLKWKVLIGGQAVVTVAIIGHRLKGIREQKARKEARKAREAQQEQLIASAATEKKE